MSDPNSGVLVWGFSQSAGEWRPGAGDFWAGDRVGNPACHLDIRALREGDLTALEPWISGPPLPEALSDSIRADLDRLMMHLDGTPWGAGAGFIEKRNRLFLLARAWFHLVSGRRWRFALFESPPCSGVDTVLLSVLRGCGVPVYQVCASPFAGRAWVADHQGHVLKLPGAPVPVAPVLAPEQSPEGKGMAALPAWLLLLVAWARVLLGASARKYLALPALRAATEPGLYRTRLSTLPWLRSRDLSGLTQPFVFVPLRRQPEAEADRLAACEAPDQVESLERLLTRLPEGWLLVLREAPGQDWRCRDDAFFARLARDARIRWAAPGIPQPELMARSGAVATASARAGWEALQAGKPVIRTGRAWFDGLSGVVSLSALTDGPWPAPVPDRLKIDMDARLALTFSGMITSTKNTDHPDSGQGAEGETDLTQLLAWIAGAESVSAF